jgi:hypothetical protein
VKGVMRFALEALQANDGDCLLLHYSPAGAPAGGVARCLVLIDGGSRGVYNTVLKPRIDALRGQQPLDLRMVMVSHIDLDHITGIVDLFKVLSDQQQAGTEPFCRIRTLWFNSFEQVHGQTHPAVAAASAASLGGPPIQGLEQWTQAVVASVPQGNQLRKLATDLQVPFNEGAGAPLVTPLATGRRTVPIADGLTFTILAPPKDQLDRLEHDWTKAKTDHPADPAAQTADYLNNTVPNMSSIVVLAEAAVTGQSPKRMLLTGDARGDVILAALDAAGLSTNGRSHFDLLKVQHHGSNHSTTQEFFERVTADRYVISGNGRHGIPHPQALGFLSAARRGQPYEVSLTNRVGVDGLQGVLDTFLAQEAAHEPLHAYRFRGEQDLSITVELAS